MIVGIQIDAFAGMNRIGRIYAVPAGYGLVVKVVVPGDGIQRVAEVHPVA